MPIVFADHRYAASDAEATTYVATLAAKRWQENEHETGAHPGKVVCRALATWNSLRIVKRGR